MTGQTVMHPTYVSDNMTFRRASFANIDESDVCFLDVIMEMLCINK